MIKTSVGLDISDSTIEVVELIKEIQGIKVVSLSRSKLEPGIVSRGRIKNKQALGEQIKKTFREAKPKPIELANIVFGLPESLVYLHIFKIAPEQRENIGEKVAEEIKTAIPLKYEELEFSYKVIKSMIVAAAVKQSAINEWRQLFKELGAGVALFDIKALACFRSIFKELPLDPVGLLDIGANSTSLSIFSSTGIKYNYSLPIAGNDLTRAVADSLKKDEQQVEELIKTSGLKDEAIKSALTPAIDEILADIENNLVYFKNINNQEVKELVLLGGTSQLPGLIDYINSKNMKARQAEAILPIPGKNITYLEAIGLALRPLDNRWDKINPGFKGIAGKQSRKINLHSLKEQLRTYCKYIHFSRVIYKKLLFVFVSILIIGMILFIFFNRGFKPAEEAIIEPMPAVIETIEADKATASSTNQSTEPTEVKYIRIKDLTSNLNVRAGPGTNFSVVGTAVPGQEFILLEENNNWQKIQLEINQEGWIFANFTEKI